MNYNVVILDSAQDEINQAFDYYANISFTVMQSFDNQLEYVYKIFSLYKLNPTWLVFLFPWLLFKV